MFETRVLRSNLFCLRWAFEDLQVVLVFIPELRRKTMNSLHFVITKVSFGGEKYSTPHFPFLKVLSTYSIPADVKTEGRSNSVTKGAHVLIF